MGVDRTRVRLMRAVHAEGLKRGLDHEALRDVCRQKFNTGSMGDLSDTQLRKIYRDWTGRTLGRSAAVVLPKRGHAKQGGLEMVSGEELELLERAFARRAWGPDTKREFIRRQLGGREQIRTRADFHRVFSGVRAMNRRNGL
jgi:hypothetical protein